MKKFQWKPTYCQANVDFKMLAETIYANFHDAKWHFYKEEPKNYSLSCKLSEQIGTVIFHPSGCITSNIGDILPSCSYLILQDGRVKEMQNCCFHFHVE